MSKRLKYKSLNFIPISYNFSDVFKEKDEDTYDPPGFEVSDLGRQAERVEEDLVLEKMIVEILHNLDDREKIIFMFQLLRDAGYNLDYESCAQTIHINRQWYMNNLKSVKQKIAFIISKNKDKE